MRDLVAAFGFCAFFDNQTGIVFDSRIFQQIFGIVERFRQIFDFAFGKFRDKTIAALMDGLDVTRRGGIVAEFAPDFFDGSRQRIIGYESFLPNCLKQFLLFDDAPAPFNQIDENVKGSRRE